LKANIGRLFVDMKEETFEACRNPQTYRKLFFSLCMFHGVILERRKFLTLGWNSVYDFSDSDFEFSHRLLVNLIDNYEQLPFEALRYLIAEVNYAGRVTDGMCICVICSIHRSQSL
jgi:dynein heavy chain